VSKLASRRVADAGPGTPDAAARPEVALAEPERHAWLAEAAYFRAQARGFDPGHELDDWIAAEQALAGLGGEPAVSAAAA
jgi:hypothetical protein